MVGMGQRKERTVKQLRVVVKVGTSTLTNGGRTLSRPTMLDICQQVVQLREQGHQVILVCSGSVAAGREVLGKQNIASTVSTRQMLSSVGQVRLMHTWAELFGIYHHTVGQVLLGRGDCTHRRRYLNVRDTLESLLTHGVIPIINENDPVATEELCFGDNDNLAALVANLIGGDLLILVTDQEGLFTGDPRTDPQAQLIPHLDTVSEKIMRSVPPNTRSELGTGGMWTKLEAAKLASESGTPTIISSLKQPQLLLRAVKGDTVGTRIAATTKREGRKRWLLTERSAGTLHIDGGAAHNIRTQGASLLPVGIRLVKGHFERGAIIDVQDPQGKICARGVASYGSEEIQRIQGRKTSEHEAELGYSRGDAVVHRDNMVSMEEG